MQATTITPRLTGTTRATWAGYTLSALSYAFLLFDAGIKILQLSPAIEATTQLGLAASVVLPLGLVQLVCLVLTVYRRTSVLGAVLLTGYLGGAVAVQLQNQTGSFSLVFPVLIGAMIWGGLWLRNPALRALMPMQS